MLSNDSVNSARTVLNSEVTCNRSTQLHDGFIGHEGATENAKIGNCNTKVHRWKMQHKIAKSMTLIT